MTRTALDLARRFIGVHEVEGVAANPLILAMLRLDVKWPTGDEVAWCSAFVNYVAWLMDLPRSKSLAARSWLAIGDPVELPKAQPGFDICVLKRGKEPQPGPEVIQAAGHVGFFAGTVGRDVILVGGNQGDAVTEGRFPESSVIGVRRLHGSTAATRDFLGVM